MDGDFRSMDRPQPTLTTPPYADMPAHDVRALMEGGTTALMVLDGVAYTLRITRAGKLILTK